jgi:hypothetical protein
MHPGFNKNDKTVTNTNAKRVWQDLITFVVGPDAAPEFFVVHKSLAIKCSPLLLTASTTELQKQSIRLDGISSSAFGLLIQWIYTHSIKDAKDRDMLSLAQLWDLGDRFLIPKLQNAVILILWELLGEDEKKGAGLEADIMSDAFLQYVFRTESGYNPMQRLVIQYLAHREIMKKLDFTQVRLSKAADRELSGAAGRQRKQLLNKLDGVSLRWKLGKLADYYVNIVEDE